MEFSTNRIPALKTQTIIGGTVFALGLWVAYEIAGMIASGNMRMVEFAALGFAGLAAVVTILRSWRTGFYFFFVWLMFEDLARKYMNNGLVLFFGKDILAALTYVSLYAAIRRGREKTFRPPFLFPLALFVWLGVIQIFNPNSPSPLYGLLGFKVDFFYIPLIWVGYALIRNDEDLRKFLVANCTVAAVIGGVGIIQALVGNSFLNPAVLDRNIAELGNLDKWTPLGGQKFNLPDSIFVSTGRFGEYLVVAFIVVAATLGYLLLSSPKGRKISFAAIAIVAVAILLSGNRGPLVYVAASALVLAVGSLWGMRRGRPESRLLWKALRRSVIVATLALAGVLVMFPDRAGTRIAFYTQTLMPTSSAYEGTWRGWGYPLENLKFAFETPHWILGNGIGVASLGRQYVAEVLHQPPPDVWVEEGFGVLIVELGIIAPFLWLIWSAALLYFCWKVVLTLRGTRFLPLAMAIFWYALLLLILLTWFGFSTYQNYINNAYLWILVGILFRLPDLRNQDTVAVATVLSGAVPAQGA